MLQIRKPQYWRIEVPNEDDEEKARVEELKLVLSKVLLFERTPCPFQRDFVVELPEAPQTPTVKRPWRPVQGPLPYSSPSRENKIVGEDDSRPSRSTSSRAQWPTGSPEVRPQSPQRPPTPRLSPSKSSKLSADLHVPKKTQKRVNPSPPHSPVATPPPSSPASTSAERAVVTTPPNRTPVTTSPPRTPDATPAPLKPITNLATQPRTTAPEALPSVVEEPTETTEITVQQLPSLVESPPIGNITGERSITGVDESYVVSEGTYDLDTPKSLFQPECHPSDTGVDILERPHALRNTTRSTTAPPVLSLITSPPSKPRTKSPPRDSNTSRKGSSHSSSVGSFYSVQSWHSILDQDRGLPESPQSSSESPTYPYPHENIVLPKRGHNSPDFDFTTAPETPGVWGSAPAPEIESSTAIYHSPNPEASVVDKSTKEGSQPVKPAAESGIRHRATTSSNSRRRELSPLPAAVNLFSPPPGRRPRRLQTARHLPTAIIQKTCEILLSPPSHLFTLMINIASKIAAGEWRGFLFSPYGEEVHWDFEDEYGRSVYSPVDDYGIALPYSNMPRRPKTDSSDAGGSWEVD